jgi:multiple sugar transport system permease protein
VYVIIKRFPMLGGNNILGNGGTGMINTYAGLIIPGFVAASGIFLLREFMRTLPRDLDDAARIDGCGEFGIFYRIILPLTRPALATLAVLTFQGVWNDFLWPLLVGQKKALWTLQVALAHMRSGVVNNSISWPHMLAATMITTLPIIIVFLFAQRYFMRGIALTGMK